MHFSYILHNPSNILSKPYVKIDSQLSSIFSFTTDLKRIQTPHSLPRDFEQTKSDKAFTTCWSGGRVQV